MLDNFSAQLSASYKAIRCPVPWAAVDHFAEAWVWRARNSTEILFGLGEAARFSRLDQCRNALQALDVPAGAPAPRGFAATAFDPNSDLAAPWIGFLPRLYVLPQTLLYWQDGKLQILSLRNVEDSAPDAEQMAERVQALPGLTKTSRFKLPAVSTEMSVDWRHAVETIKARIAEKAVEKVVLARALECAANVPQANETRAGAILERLHDANDGYLFACRRADGIFLSATPERLFRLRGTHLETESLAGTRPRGATPDNDDRLARELLHSEKDLREQNIVTDYLKTALNNLDCGDPEASVRSVRKHTAAQHLCTQLSGKIKADASLDDILAALHPTPAVCGYPVAPARAILHELEDDARGYYAGAVGCVGVAESEFAVGIRAALLTHRSARLFAGAGIVAGSDPAAEWKETEIKLQPMLNALCGDRN